MRYILLILGLFLISTVSIFLIKNKYPTQVPTTGKVETIDITPTPIPTPINSIQPTPIQGHLPTEGLAGQILTKEDYDSLLAISNKALQYIKDKNFDKLSELAHSPGGVTFFPYYSYPEPMRQLNREEVKNFFKDTKIHVWGEGDGSGLPIEKTNAEYYKSSIFDHDYTKAEKVGVNIQYSVGNFADLKDLVEFFGSETRFVEYYFSGFDPEFQGMDWSALTLAFIKENNKWWLVGIYHGMWLI